MISRKRPSPPPSYETSSLRKNQEVEIDKWRNALIEGTQQGTRVKRARYSLALPIRHKAVPNFITELLDAFDHKCPFCETKLDADRMEVCFYRPPYGALQEANGQPDEHYYCWLIWQWSNLFPACESCTNRKGILFPVAQERSNLGIRRDDVLRKEEPFLLDPCYDNPDKYLQFHQDGTLTAKPGSNRGGKTIEVFSLNRERLQASRKSEAEVLRKAWEEELQKTGASPAVVREILWQAYCLDNQQFAGMKRQLLRLWSKDIGARTGPSISADISLGDKRPPDTDKLAVPKSDKRPLRIFLCHAHSDVNAVRSLYMRLKGDHMDVWLDKEKLLPGSNWELEIRNAVRQADVVLVCLSKQFNQAGFRQKEVRIALDTALEKTEDEIFIIPVRLEECEDLESLKKWHWVNLFEEQDFERLVQALRQVAEAKRLS